MAARPQGTLLSVRQNVRSNPRGAGLGRVVRDLRMRRDQSLLEIRLNESRTGVDVDLTQDRVTGVNEAVRRVRGNHDDTSRFHFLCFMADCNAGAAFDCERDFDIRMRVQRRTLAWLRVD